MLQCHHVSSFTIHGTRITCSRLVAAPLSSPYRPHCASCHTSSEGNQSRMQKSKYFPYGKICFRHLYVFLRKLLIKSMQPKYDVTLRLLMAQRTIWANSQGITFGFGRSQKEKFGINSQEAGIYRGSLLNICAEHFRLYCYITAVSPHNVIRGVKFSVLLHCSLMSVASRFILWDESWSKQYYVLRRTTCQPVILQEALINIFPHHGSIGGWRFHYNPNSWMFPSNLLHTSQYNIYP